MNFIHNYLQIDKKRVIITEIIKKSTLLHTYNLLK